jgi:hypothetical protein
MATVAACDKDEDDGNGSTPAALDAPALAAATVTVNTATVEWTSSASLFEIKLNDGAVVEKNTKTHEFSGLNAATSYTWQVRAKNAETYSAWASGTFTTEVAPTPPPADPTGLSVFPGYNSADFSWESDAEYFEIKVYNTTFDATYYGSAQDLIQGTYTQAYGLQPETLYSWKVRVSDDNETFSNEVAGPDFTTEVAPTPPPSPTGATVFFDNGGTTADSWSAAAYQISETEGVIVVQLFKNSITNDDLLDATDALLPYVFFVFPGTEEGAYTYGEYADYFYVTYNRQGSMDHWNTEDNSNTVAITTYANGKLGGTVSVNVTNGARTMPLNITLINLEANDELVILNGE